MHLSCSFHPPSRLTLHAVVCVCLCHEQMFMKSATPDSGRPLSSQCANALLWLAVYAGISHLEVLHMFVSQLSEDTPVRLFIVHCHDATALFFACFTAQFGCESGMKVTLCRWDNGVGPLQRDRAFGAWFAERLERSTWAVSEQHVWPRHKGHGPRDDDCKARRVPHLSPKTRETTH